MLIRLGHSPDPDDAFMFWGLAAGEVDTARLRVRARPRGHPDAERVGARGPARGDRDLAPRVPVRPGPYVLLPHGASMGSGYGPIVVAREELTRGRPAPGRDRRARAHDDRVPCAAAAARRLLATARCRSTRSWTRCRRARPTRACSSTRGSSRTQPPACTRSSTSASGGWLETGLPLPLGANVARRDLGQDVLRELSDVLAESIRAGLDNRERGARVRAPVGPRPRRRARRPLRRHVRERADRGLRRRGPGGGPRAAPPRRGDRRVRPARQRRVRRLASLHGPRDARPCERCNVPLDPGGEAYICTFECTWASACAGELAYVLSELRR